MVLSAHHVFTIQSSGNHDSLVNDTALKKCSLCKTSLNLFPFLWCKQFNLFMMNVTVLGLLDPLWWRTSLFSTLAAIIAYVKTLLRDVVSNVKLELQSHHCWENLMQDGLAHIRAILHTTRTWRTKAFMFELLLACLPIYVRCSPCTLTKWRNEAVQSSLISISDSIHSRIGLRLEYTWSLTLVHRVSSLWFLGKAARDAVCYLLRHA